MKTPCGVFRATRARSSLTVLVPATLRAVHRKLGALGPDCQSPVDANCDTLKVITDLKLSLKATGNPSLLEKDNVFKSVVESQIWLGFKGRYGRIAGKVIPRSIGTP